MNEYFKDNVGKILFIASLALLIYMFFSPLSKVFVHPDDYFSLGVVNFSYLDIITVSTRDTLPPLYHLILRMFIDLFNVLPVNLDVQFVPKFVSTLPYILILVISWLKLKPEYGWLATGLFVFSLGLMSEFFIHFLTIRMYSWALFFFLLSFIYLKDVMVYSDLKSWALFIIFTILGVFTHYYVAISSFILYVFLFLYLLFNRKEDLKKLIGFVICGAILFVPWITILLTQVNRVQGGSFSSIIFNVESVLSSFAFFAVQTDSVIISIILIAVLVFFIFISIKTYAQHKTTENFYILVGIFAFIGTIIIACIVSLLFRPMLLTRYLIPVASVFWLSISILISKLEDKKLLSISLILIIFLSALSIGTLYDSTDHLYNKGMKQFDTFDEIKNDDDAIIIYNSGVGIMEFAKFLNNTNDDVYSFELHNPYGLNNSIIHDFANFEEKDPEEIQQIIDNNHGKDIYFIDAFSQNDLDNKTNLTQIGNVGGAKFYRVTD